ncbi:MAG: precorrin-2 C(20)-methyltransferase [Bacillota bacterium]|nr:precorrin-2 C(20)-methyltransferase [Bacillota bacterium]
MKGKFYGIGVGPGDPELMTIKGKRILEEADYIATPKTKGDSESTALHIVSPYIQGKEVIDLVLPMTKDTAILEQAWNDGAKRIMEYLDQGKNVAFITLGDPSLFSTFMYVFRPVRAAGYEWEIVPGINAPSAAAAKLGIGLADGKENIAIMAATTDLEEVERTIANHDNTVLMKGAGKWQSIAEILEREGLTDRTAAVERCTMEGERIFPDIKEMPEDLSYFLTAIVRKGLK